ncbi:MAG TPA: hypothetical protein VF456_16725 [Vicinamibacterales bacterium]
MKVVSACVAGAIVAAAVTIFAQQTPAPAAPQAPKGQMPELGRPTQTTDTVPLFNFDEYFLGGKWTFEWLVPESPLGPAGTITGTTSYTASGGDGKFYQARTEATGPGGKFTITERIAYQKDNKTITRYVSDSRGYSYLQTAVVGGDLGGFYNMYFESEPFTFKGKSIRIRDAYRLVSPVNYRVATTIAIDGGRFTNYGNPWWQKDVAGAK